MAVIKLFVFIIGVCFVKVVYCNANSGSDMYCSDPDTGDLHPVNATWQSKTFCGSYACKLRKINNTEILNKPNITNDNAVEPTVVASKSDVEEQNTNGTLKSNVQVKKEINETNNTSTEKIDRFLTDSEIKSITKFLHTVKRSDLEALLEMYNTAEDIYKEMEASATENIGIASRYTNSDQTTRALKQQTPFPLLSYSYDPYSYYNNIQIKTPNDAISAQTISNQISQSIPVLPKHDTKKYPYALPILAYPTLIQNPYAQNVATGLQTNTNTNNNNKPECLNGIINQNSMAAYSPFVNKLIKPINSIQTDYKKYQPLQMIPYPFSYQYNISYPYQSIPSTSNQQVLTNAARPHIGTAIITHVPNNIYNPQNPLINERMTNDEGKTLMQPWQTEPLSTNVLDEIRANLMEKSKRLLQPLPKKVKLENIGKVLRLEDLIRNRRDAELSSDIDDKYETFIEKIECPQDHEPGYFRMGDPTQPYPGCCPQRIDIS